MLELLTCQLINKFSMVNPFRTFSGYCKACEKKYSEIFVDFFIDEKVSCEKCLLKAKIFTKIISWALNIIADALKMPRNQFKLILKENNSMRRLVQTYLEGIGIFGLNIPLIPAGPIITIWTITDRCNLNCTHCYLPKNNNHKELTYAESCKIIDELQQAKNMIIGFSGGEPLLRKDIFDLIKYVSDKQMSVALATNGLLIDENVAKKLKDSGLGYVQISIDGLEETHDIIRGEGTFQRALSAIKNCLDAGLYVSMDVVITKLNVNQIHDLISLAKGLKVQKFEILDFVPSENACMRADMALTPLQMERFGKIVCDIWNDLMTDSYPLTLSYKNPIFSRILAQRFPNVQIMPFFKGIYPKDALKFFNFSKRLSTGVFEEQHPFSPFITGCEAGFYTIHVKSDGNVTPCPLNPDVIGDAIRTNIHKIWLHSPILNKYRKLKFDGNCGKCTYRSICGGCRAKCYVLKDNHFTSDPTCYLNSIKSHS
ncbi:MAG: radical SAM protein [Candidatus Lokiarchaeota archaeon]|nr:radical SAM protein [Candidatus Lokiarchaeota archaeon]